MTFAVLFTNITAIPQPRPMTGSTTVPVSNAEIAPQPIWRPTRQAVVKDRLFFFYNYEGMREAKGESVVQVVPTASLGQGNIQFVDNTGQSWNVTAAQINTMTVSGLPVVNVNPLVTTLFSQAAARYPVNDDTQGDGRNSGGFRFNASTPVRAECSYCPTRLECYTGSETRHFIPWKLSAGHNRLPVVFPGHAFDQFLESSAWNGSDPYLVAEQQYDQSAQLSINAITFSDQGDSDPPQFNVSIHLSAVGF